MLQRRAFIGAGVSATAALLCYLPRASAAADEIFGFERGEPDFNPEAAFYNGERIDNLFLGQSKAQIPDPILDFPEQLVRTALRYEGYSRRSNEQAISEMLQTFYAPFREDGRYVPFCAAGVGYCAAQLYGGGFGRPIAAYQGILPTVEFYNFWPSSSCRSMALVAMGKGKFEVAKPGQKVPKRGWIVLYDWSQSGGWDATDHCGIVLDADGSQLHTIEFNTGDPQDSNQRDGGVVLRKTRPYNRTVKGFIRTETRKT